jgi:hypothetical protein
MIGRRLLLLMCLCPAAGAVTNLNLSAESGGRNTVSVTPGATVSYSIVGELSDSGSKASRWSASIFPSAAAR